MGHRIRSRKLPGGHRRVLLPVTEHARRVSHAFIGSAKGKQRESAGGAAACRMDGWPAPAFPVNTKTLERQLGPPRDDAGERLPLVVRVSSASGGRRSRQRPIVLRSGSPFRSAAQLSPVRDDFGDPALPIPGLATVLYLLDSRNEPPAAGHDQRSTFDPRAGTEERDDETGAPAADPQHALCRSALVDSVRRPVFPMIPAVVPVRPQGIGSAS